MTRILLTAALLLAATPSWAGERQDCRGQQCRVRSEPVVRRPPVDYDRVQRILNAEILRQSRRTECVGIDFGGGISTLSCD
jgi:hypothetical protein